MQTKGTSKGGAGGRRKSVPWGRPNPKPAGQRTKLSAEARERARARAEEAGRRYPNLVDNMWAARLMKRGPGKA